MPDGSEEGDRPDEPVGVCKQMLVRETAYEELRPVDGGNRIPLCLPVLFGTRSAVAEASNASLDTLLRRRRRAAGKDQQRRAEQQVNDGGARQADHPVRS